MTRRSNEPTGYTAARRCGPPQHGFMTGSLSATVTHRIAVVGTAGPHGSPIIVTPSRNAMTVGPVDCSRRPGAGRFLLLALITTPLPNYVISRHLSRLLYLRRGNNEEGLAAIMCACVLGT